MITVVTAVTGGKDDLRHDQNKGSAKWLAFTEHQFSSKTWEHRPVHDRFKSERRNSRIHKMLIHQYVDTKYSIWMDANLKLLITPEEVVERYLQDSDIAVFKHPNRDCLYDEAIICAKNRLDDPEVIIEQVKGYEDSGYGKHRGLAECSFIIRRHNARTEAFNNAWWAEYCRHSVRDQISFPYAINKAGIEVHYIDQPWTDLVAEAYRGDVIHAVPHLTPRIEA
jgi:hypothetical protein